MMVSSHGHNAVNNLFSLLAEWDKGSKQFRKQILLNFNKQNQNKTGPEIESEFADCASLFLTRLTAWLRLSYMTSFCLTEQLQAINIFVSASSGQTYVSEFIEVGGILTLLDILALKEAKEENKNEALLVLMSIIDTGRQNKELVCESFGINTIAECLAKSQSKKTQENARLALQMLANGNPRFCNQIYKGLIALLSCSSPKAQEMAALALKSVQPIVKTALPTMVTPLLTLLRSLHVEVQYEVISLIELLMDYEVRMALLEGLVKLLDPENSEHDVRPKILDEDSFSALGKPLPLYIQQAASSKCIGRLCKRSDDIAKILLDMKVVHNLLLSAGNANHADSQIQACVTLWNLAKAFHKVDATIHNAMGDDLYHLFMNDPECLYSKMDYVQADILQSNIVDAKDEVYY